MPAPLPPYVPHRHALPHRVFKAFFLALFFILFPGVVAKEDRRKEWVELDTIKNDKLFSKNMIFPPIEKNDFLFQKIWN